MPHQEVIQQTMHPSFPRRWESIRVEKLDSRLRGNDGAFWAWLLALCAVLLAVIPLQLSAKEYYSGNTRGPGSTTVADLPPEARTTLQLIKKGGPFPYARDGVVFGNFEKRLPRQPRGYYHEYTVKTPGARDRGARRIVCGPLPECYYSGDHYKSFQRIRE